MIDQIEKMAGKKSARTKISRKTDGSKFLTPHQIADRWGWHPESIRRAIRERRIESAIISRRRLVPLTEIERIETEGHMARIP